MTSHHPTTTIIPNSLFSPLSQDYEYSMSLGEDEVQQQAQAEENEPKPSATFSFTKSRQQRDPTPQLQRYNATTTAITAVDSSIYTYTPKSLIEQVQQEVTTPAGKSREHPNNNSLIGKDVDELLAYIDNLGFAPTPQFKPETTSSAAASSSMKMQRTPWKSPLPQQQNSNSNAMNSSMAAEFGSGQKSLLQRVSEDEADDDKTDGTLSIVLQRPIPRRWNANHPNSNHPGYLTSAFRPLHSLDVSMSTTTDESSEMMHLQQRPPAPVPPGSSGSSSSSTSEMSAAGAGKKQHSNPSNWNKRAGVVFADRTNNNNVTVKSTTTSLFVKPPKPEKTPYKQQPRTQTQAISRKSAIDPTPQKVLNANANSSFVVSDQGDGLIPTRRLAQEPEGQGGGVNQSKEESSIVLGAALYSDDDDDDSLLLQQQHNASAHPTPAKKRTTFLTPPSSTTRGGFSQNDSAIRSTVAEQGSIHLPATPATQQGWNLNDDSAILSTVAEQGSILHPQTTPTTPGPSSYAQRGNVLFHDTPGGDIRSTVAEQGSVSAPHLLQTPATSATKSKNIFHLIDQQAPADEQPQQDDVSTTLFSPREQQFMVRSPEDAKQLLRTAVAALQEARQERDAAREWAHHMKASVEQWATEQRKLIEVEQRTAASQNNNNHESSDDTTSQVPVHNVIQKLELAIRSLQDQVQATAYDRRKTERDLQQMLQDQQGKLDSLGHQMAVMEQTLSEASHASGSPRAVGGNLPPAYIDKLTASAAKKCSPKSTLTTTPKASSGNASTTSSRIRKRLQDGGHVVVYGNGVRKEVHRDGTTIVRFPETGDIETKFTSGTVAYYHARENVMQVTTLDGAVLYEYPNRQVERHYPDGSKAILYPDGTKQKIASNGKVEASVVPLFHNDGE